jgi:site-specific DNA recombinase
MSINLRDFSSFGNKPKSTTSFVDSNLVVTYSRVSSKEQHDTNLSLETQNKAMQEYARRNGKTIAASFGGTYESAKTDGRKEFQRMLDYIGKNKGKISQILVYLTDRFSRTGGAAIKLAEDLRQKYGVTIYAIAQPTDTRDESGVFSQNLQFLFSHYDNRLRRKRAIDGMRTKFEKGHWVTRTPQGYDMVKINGERKIVINETGKKLRKAFLWKAEGMKNEEIIKRLNAMDVRMYKQQLTKVFKKPFYCGIINHALLDGKVVEGSHPPLVSKEIFLRVNNIHQQSANYGVPHKKENNNVPLKVFIKCADCSEPFTGYIVKAKGLWYYKCRTTGCKCNKNADKMHGLFKELLSRFMVREELIPAICYQLEYAYYEVNKENLEQEKTLRLQLTEVTKKIETIEEKYFVLAEMSKETFEKFYTRYKQEELNICRQLENYTGEISNLQELIKSTVELSSKLALVWDSSDFKTKEKLQKLIFPEGIVFERKKEAFRTPAVNSVFRAIAELNSISCDNEKGTNHSIHDLSPSAERRGFEP